MHRIALKRACVLFPDVRSERPEGESCRVLSVGLGLTLALRPGAGALALVWFIGAYFDKLRSSPTNARDMASQLGTAIFGP